MPDNTIREKDFLNMYSKGNWYLMEMNFDLYLTWNRINLKIDHVCN